MKIAVASQNLSTISGHAGRCRKFRIYEVEEKRVARKSLLELPLARRFQAVPRTAPTHSMWSTCSSPGG